MIDYNKEREKYIKQLYENLLIELNANNYCLINIDVIIDFNNSVNYCNLKVEFYNLNAFNVDKDKKRFIIYNNKSMSYILFNPSFSKFFKAFIYCMDDSLIN